MTVSRYALVEDGVVKNLVSWDGEGDLFEGYTVIELEQDVEVSIGWSYADSTFTAPPVPELSQAEKIASAEQEQSSRLDVAKSAIVIWQTKLLMGRKLTDTETSQLNAWMDYIDAVTAVDTSTAPDIAWPEQPAT
ncbi:TPA: tail fiber assembly protein [Enterobacter roggenkampii]|nr:tail fiber assembly protein [Enterobacter roggenkampii]HAT7723082.1 tail fiber assembly protein [Enterobacter roggenkampii]